MKKKPMSMIDKAAVCILTVCIVVLLVSIGGYFFIRITSDEVVTKINIVLDEPALSNDSTLYAREGIDSLMRMVAVHEQVINDKYQYVIEQKDKDETMLSFGAVLVGVVLSVFGFFGYKSMKAVEDKAENIAEDLAKETAEETAEAEVQSFLKKNLGTLMDNQSKKYFESDLATQMRKELEEHLERKMADAIVKIKTEVETELETRRRDDAELDKLVGSDKKDMDHGETYDTSIAEKKDTGGMFR